MVKLIMGLPGSGKTKTLVDMVKEAVSSDSNNVVCIERGKDLTFDIPYQARLIPADEFGINSNSLLQGFLSGLHAGNYDITHVFIDGLYKILDDDSTEAVESLLNWMDQFSQRANIQFTLSLSGDPAKASEGIRKYL